MAELGETAGSKFATCDEPRAHFLFSQQATLQEAAKCVKSLVQVNEELRDKLCRKEVAEKALVKFAQEQNRKVQELQREIKRLNAELGQETEQGKSEGILLLFWGHPHIISR